MLDAAVLERCCRPSRSWLCGVCEWPLRSCRRGPAWLPSQRKTQLHPLHPRPGGLPLVRAHSACLVGPVRTWLRPSLRHADRAAAVAGADSFLAGAGGDGARGALTCFVASPRARNADRAAAVAGADSFLAGAGGDGARGWTSHRRGERPRRRPTGSLRDRRAVAHSGWDRVDHLAHPYARGARRGCGGGLQPGGRRVATPRLARH